MIFFQIEKLGFLHFAVKDAYVQRKKEKQWEVVGQKEYIHIACYNTKLVRLIKCLDKWI